MQITGIFEQDRLKKRLLSGEIIDLHNDNGDYVFLTKSTVGDKRYNFMLNGVCIYDAKTFTTFIKKINYFIYKYNLVIEKETITDSL